jgi:transposase
MGHDRSRIGEWMLPKKYLLRQYSRRNDMSRFIGVDLHKKSFTVSFYNSESNKHDLRTFKLKAIDVFHKRLDKEDVISVEMTGNTRYFVEQVRDYVKEVKVINPLQFAVISKSTKKTDKHDAKLIAEFTSKGMIPEINLKDKITSQISSLTQTRDKLVKLRTTLKNKIHSLLNSKGIALDKKQLSSNKGLKNLLKYKLDYIVQVELEVIINQIENLNEGIKRLDKEIIEQGKNMEGFDSITSITGIGEKSGTILLCAIGDINKFKSPKKLASYIGIVPRVNQSGEKEKHGRITKHGNRLARATLVQCTLVAINYSNYLKKFYSKIKVKKGSGKAIIATAHKLLNIIYDTLKNKWVFEDFKNYKIKTT